MSLEAGPTSKPLISFRILRGELDNSCGSFKAIDCCWCIRELAHGNGQSDIMNAWTERRTSKGHRCTSHAWWTHSIFSNRVTSCTFCFGIVFKLKATRHFVNTVLDLFRFGMHAGWSGHVRGTSRLHNRVYMPAGRGLRFAFQSFFFG